MPNLSGNGLLKRCQTVVKCLTRAAWLIIALALVVAVLSVYYTSKRLTLRTSRSDLVSSDQQLIALQKKLEKEFGTRDGLVVVVENHNKRRSIDFAEALAVKLRQKPKIYREIFYRVNPDPFKSWALLYLKPDELKDLKDKLLTNQRVLTSIAQEPNLSRFFQGINEEITRALVGALFTDFLEDKNNKEKLPDLSLLNATLTQFHAGLAGGRPYVSPFKTFFPGDIGDLSEEGYFFTENDKYLLFLVTSEEDGFTTTSKCLKNLRKTVARVHARFPDLNVGVTGPEALEADEMNEALKDISLATWLSLLGQMLLLIIFLRSLKRPLVECLVLVVGLCWTFGMLTLVVGHLNLLSIVFVPLMLGLTIDYGIHWWCRLEEEQSGARFVTVRNLACTLKRSGPGIIYAGLVAAASFLPLVFAGFKGLAELGLIISMGILLMLLATLVLLPALVSVTERSHPAEFEEECPGHPRPFLSLRWRRPGLVVAIGMTLMGLGGLSLLYVPFDLNPLRLQNKRAESVAWELKLIAGSRYSTTFGALAATDLEDLQAKTQAFKNLPTVSHVESILSFLPEDPAGKRRLLQDLKPVVEQINFSSRQAAASPPEELAAILGRIRFKLSRATESDWKPESKVTLKQLEEACTLLDRITPLLDPKLHPDTVPRLAAFQKDFFSDLTDKWNLIRANVEEKAPLMIQDLPLSVRQRFISPEGNYMIRVFPALDIWDLPPLSRFVGDMRSVDPKVVGDPVLLYVFTTQFRYSCLWAAGMALVAITFLLLLFFRSLKLTLLALLPLLVGTGWTLNLMWLFDLPFNQANVLFLPLILGEGVEFGIIILMRWKQESSAQAITLPASTAKGVLLAALTTTVGFGSLMVSGHRGVFSLGLLATVGSLSVLLASLSVLPAFLRLLERNYKTEAAARPMPGALWAFLKGNRGSK